MIELKLWLKILNFWKISYPSLIIMIKSPKFDFLKTIFSQYIEKRYGYVNYLHMHLWKSLFPASLKCFIYLFYLKIKIFFEFLTIFLKLVIEFEDGNVNNNSNKLSK